MFQKKILKNGLRLLEAPMDGVDTATILVLLGVGSRYENKKNNGISHMLEHLAFKGTTARPSSFLISKELDSIGANYNAFTGEEYTGYYVKVRSANLEKGTEILSDIVLDPLLRESSINEEKKVITEEIRMYHDSPNHYADQLIGNLVFKGNPLGFDIAGTEKSVLSLDRKSILDFRRRHYRADDTVIAVAGKFEKSIEKIITKCFPLKSADKKPKYVAFRKKNNGKEVIIDRRRTKQSHLRLATYGLKIEDEDRYAYNLLGLILGGSMSSRLFEEVREKRSLAYYINAYAESYQDCGYCLVKAGVNSDRLYEAVEAIRDEVYKTQKDITNEEVERAREMFKGSIAIEKEDSEELAWFYGFQELLESRIKDYEEIIKRIDAVEKDDIKRVARKIFAAKEIFISLVGQGDKDKLLKLIGG